MIFSKSMVILVAAHKPSWVSGESVYHPIQVGAEGCEPIGFIGDNTGVNMSLKNPNYCELTALYWFWKNNYAAIVGLCHYRRYFSNGRYASDISSKQQSILREEDYRALLGAYDCILPKMRNYYIESVRSQYEHAHHKEDLAALESVIREYYPGYIDAFNTVMNGKQLHLFNMFVMPWNLFDNYCTFLFDILEKVENRLDISNYSQEDARVFGYLAERLFNVWLLKNEIKYKEVPVVFLGKINWIKKGFKFLKRKFLA